MTTVLKRARERPNETSPEGGHHPVSAAEALRAKAAPGASLYKARTPIYPKLVHGRWRTVKWALLVATLAVYYITPWIRWHRPEGLPQQAVLIDFAGPRFYFFFIQLWPQEVYFITGLLVVAALTLFLVTALFGRLWCGYTCPQTVWTDLFIVVERFFEGDRNARMRLDAQPMSLNKALRKGGKHLAWILVALSTGGAWIFYFHDAPSLWRELWVGQAPITAYVSMGILTATTYLLAGTMREQVCIYLCPWPRIQGAMLDEHSLQVTYLADRGEPRRPHKKGESWEGRGDCVDCRQCVIVCPMGIDIRDGGQIACINCGLCVDACDEIMVRVGRPTGLIGYDTPHAVESRVSGSQRPRYPYVRPRTVFYAAALAGVGALMVYGLATRSPVVFDILRDRNPTFVRLHDGSVRNGYTLKIANRTFAAQNYAVTLTGLSAATLKPPVGAPTSGPVRFAVPADQVGSLRLLVTAPPGALPAANMPVVFHIRSGRIAADKASIFLSGAANPQ